MTTRPPIVCLCGSTRFRAEFDATNRQFTRAGRIVLAPGVFGHADGITIPENDKAALDALHLAKIDLADAVFVVNPGGYVGDSTRAEIAYATRLGKRIGYLVDPDREPVDDGGALNDYGRDYAEEDANRRELCREEEAELVDEQRAEGARLRATLATIAELTGYANGLYPEEDGQ